MQAAMLHPFGLLLLLASGLAAGVMWSLAPTSYWPNRAIGVVVTGFLAYVAVVIAASRWRPSPPAIRRIRSARLRVRRLIWDRLQRVKSAARERLLEEARRAVQQIDDTIIPAFESLVKLNLGLGAQIAALERADPPPSPAVLAPSREIHESRRGSITECAQLAADAEAELVQLLQEGDEDVLLRRLTDWTEALERIFDALDIAISGPGPLPAPQPPDLPEVQPPESVPVPSLANIPALAPPSKDFQPLIERELRHLNNARALGESPLAAQLSRSILAIVMARQTGSSEQPTTLDKGHALREILVGGIERLRVADRETSAQPPQYHILREEYVLQLENKIIQVRHDIPETNFYKQRRDGVQALTAELWQRERQMEAASEP
ncbi:MAG: hypothetical protein HW416_3128 [Chloroflexi bacterium]|nr:hypothetical protein [Chloroflexota bacterium]